MVTFCGRFDTSIHDLLVMEMLKPLLLSLNLNHMVLMLQLLNMSVLATCKKGYDQHYEN